MRVGVLAAAAVLLSGAYVLWQRIRTGEPVETAISEVISQGADQIEAAASQAVDFVSGGSMRISRMRDVKPAMLVNANVRAMLRVIRTGEGTADAGGYNRLFGGGTFDGYADHPRVLVKKGGYSSTAAGAYQFLSSTWDETRQMMSLPDFSPYSQDLGAVGRIAARGALDDVLAGRFDIAIGKLGKEWASLPGSPYGQPTISLARARSIYAAAGGNAFA
jgi:muramidase (phage lysozyme)